VRSYNDGALRRSQMTAFCMHKIWTHFACAPLAAPPCVAPNLSWDSTLLRGGAAILRGLDIHATYASDQALLCRWWSQRVQKALEPWRWYYSIGRARCCTRQGAPRVQAQSVPHCTATSCGALIIPKPNPHASHWEKRLTAPHVRVLTGFILFTPVVNWPTRQYCGIGVYLVQRQCLRCGSAGQPE